MAGKMSDWVYAGGKAGNTFDAEERMRKAESGGVQSCVQEGQDLVGLGSKQCSEEGWVSCQVMWWVFIALVLLWMDEYGSSVQVSGEYIVVSWDGNAVTVLGRDVCGNYHWLTGVKSTLTAFHSAHSSNHGSSSKPCYK